MPKAATTFFLKLSSLGFITLTAFVLALTMGSVSIEWAEVLAGVRGEHLSVDYAVVVQLRLPRARPV